MILKADGISKNYIRKSGEANVLTAVEKTDFPMEPGNIYVVMGRSGSGKSTLMNILAGILEPTSGKVIVSGEDGTDIDLYSLSDDALSNYRNKYFGYIPQVQSPIGSLTVLENILLPISLGAEKPSGQEAAINPAENPAEDRAYDLMKELGIINLSDIMPRELSGGELRRVAIARALINDPKFIFADEPTGDLDDESTRQVLSLLRKCADQGASVLMVTHERDAADYGDSVFQMSSGSLKTL